MQITDPIADLLTRIRNASSAKHATVDIPASNMKKAITQILLDEGYIKNFQVIEDSKQGIIRVTLKYGENKSKVITGLKRVSRPGPENLCRRRRAPEGTSRAGYRHHFYVEGNHDRQRGTRKPYRWRGTGVYLVIALCVMIRRCNTNVKNRLQPDYDPGRCRHQD